MTSRLLDAHSDLVEPRTLARIAVPAFLTTVAFAVVLTTIDGMALTQSRGAAAEAAPTPYSADHARIQGPAAEQPPTF